MLFFKYVSPLIEKEIQRSNKELPKSKIKTWANAALEKVKRFLSSK